MLLSRQKPAAKSIQLNMAAMIDVVFLMLIFFMCTSSLLRPEKNLPSQLPLAGSPGAAAEELDPVRIRLLPGAGAARITCDNQPCATVDELVRRLRARRALGDPLVVIQGHDDVAFGDMVAALDACYRAELYRTAFSAKGAEP
jgi:biopolymer transport protein ExbD